MSMRKLSDYSDYLKDIFYGGMYRNKDVRRSAAWLKRYTNRRGRAMRKQADLREWAKEEVD